ncbi:threonine-phosphate decarboxylase CobD [Rhizobium halophilum]|uniref:threonine-phosphate decarboxylase CobD n=1 Tax=Rhizobium halophilum TaxID=2846852 RepID=UPI001EFC4054|nr:threonine-phosphate decarboxylase CobD [Rhizobium halophilum]MCF6370173.1 threonine-phosphate decarboxylase CobD [Rhizobium halophilum]
MRSGASETEEEIQHGGNLARARAAFPLAPEPWIDLSTGINPHSYPFSALPAKAFSSLPDVELGERLKLVAANAYEAPSPAHIVAAPGTQLLLPLIARLGNGSKAAVLSPTYAEHARAAKLAGLEVTETEELAELAESDLAVVVNPNNPTGRLVSRAELLEVASHLGNNGGLLVVDEAFGEVGEGGSLANAVNRGGLVVLRSFGKFFGMAGIRLGFAIAPPYIVKKLEEQLGPWSVSGPALHIALEALVDEHWKSSMRQRLAEEAQRLDAQLASAGIIVAGGTSLFRFLQHEKARLIYETLGRQGVLIRKFDERPRDLRIGLPADHEWGRLVKALGELTV